MTTTWTDNPLVAGTTKIRKIHIEELRTAINSEIGRRGGTARSFSNPVLHDGSQPNPTKCRAAHVQELRDACDYAADLPCTTDTIVPGTWTDTLNAGTTKIRAIHVQELRTYINNMESGCMCDCDGHCACHGKCCECDHCSSHCYWHC